MLSILRFNLNILGCLLRFRAGPSGGRMPRNLPGRCDDIVSSANPRAAEAYREAVPRSYPSPS